MRNDSNEILLLLLLISFDFMLSLSKSNKFPCYKFDVFSSIYGRLIFNKWLVNTVDSNFIIIHIQIFLSLWVEIPTNIVLIRRLMCSNIVQIVFKHSRNASHLIGNSRKIWYFNEKVLDSIWLMFAISHYQLISFDAVCMHNGDEHWPSVYWMAFRFVGIYGLINQSIKHLFWSLFLLPNVFVIRPTRVE